MKFLVILDESEKIDLEEKGLIKESKPIFKEMLVGKDGQSVYITQEHLNCLIEYSQRKMIEQEIEREKKFFNDIKLFGEKVAEMKESLDRYRTVRKENKQYPFIDLPNMECDNNGNYIYIKENKE